ncbi:MAG: alkaline phosphatase [Pseudomonadota bacterium]
MRVTLVLLTILAVANAGCATPAEPAQPSPAQANAASLDPSIAHRIGVVPNTNRARNVILFVGDGMGIATVTASRILAGQRAGGSGEENLLSFERFPHLALIKTYNTNAQVPDSAGTATAMLSGRKTRAGVINVAPTLARGDCQRAQRNRLKMLTRDAEERGLATGIVSTTRVTHATPASAYAVSPDRNYESDRDIPSDDRNHCADIARQLTGFDAGDGIDVVLGGGYSKFVGQSLGGDRLADDANLIRDWMARAPNRRFVSTRDDLLAAPLDGQLFGLFSRSHLSFEAQRDVDSAQPSLTDMTVHALKMLEARDSGYLLLVEGGRIDHAHHGALAGLALAETIEFANAIDAVLARVDTDETLVLVTADHSHTLSIAGYAARGNPMLGLVTSVDAAGNTKGAPERAADGQPYTTLIYANGPGAPPTPRERPTPDTGLGAVYQAAIPVGARTLDGAFRGSETHGGTDVALYATGPWAHLAGGVLEQNAVYHIMRHALGFDASSD